ncbi:MAG TPA: NAD(P)H-binding protein [Gemmatimonadaceae bacterium]|jgi:uncharacterized protein YbjT (DUF2867 family)|nr:NAD(P)H-binding protein [Gemmatimonadaceae bacterium]
MRLLVLGASGGVGRWLTRFAAEGGHEVTALVRPTATFDAPANVRVIRGDVLDAATLAAAVQGQDAVASCLGLRRASKAPWAALKSPPDLTACVTASLVPIMERSGPRRIVAISAGGVAESITQLSAPVRWLVSAGNVAVAYRDLAEMERLLSASRLDWLAVRPVTLMDGKPTGRAGPVTRYGLFSIIRRADVAAWMLGGLVRKTPFIEQTVLLGTV